MCRWISYQGKPIFIDDLVTVPVHSLVEQSLNSKLNYIALLYFRSLPDAILAYVACSLINIPSVIQNFSNF